MKEIVIVVLVMLLGSLFMTFAPDETKQWKEQDQKQKQLMKQLFKQSGLPAMEFDVRSMQERGE
jgi:hypothetical protein